MKSVESNLKNFHHKEKIFLYFFNFVSIWDEGCSLSLLWYHLTMYVSHIIKLYTLNL